MQLKEVIIWNILKWLLTFFWQTHTTHPITMHYAKVVKTRFEVLNFDKLILHQFSTKMSQIFNNGIKKTKFLKK